MKRSLLNLVLIGAGATLLVACGGGGGGGMAGGGGGGGGSTPKLESAFGAGFATSFQASADTDPREPAAADVIALNLTADPVPVP